MSLFSLKGRVALVTGGYGHLGRAMSEALAEAGAKVVVAGRSQEKMISAFGKDNSAFQFLQMDISDRSSIESAVAKIKSDSGQLDILVNNAINSPHISNPQADEKTAWREGLLGNLETVREVTEQFIPVLLKSKTGSVINVSSMYGLVAPDFRIYKGASQFSKSPSYYGTAKAGLVQLTRYWASFYGDQGLRFNCLSPGPFPKESALKDLEFAEELKERTLLRKLGRPEELGGPCVFLASSASSYMTGQNLIIDGGWTVR